MYYKDSCTLGTYSGLFTAACKRRRRPGQTVACKAMHRLFFLMNDHGTNMRYAHSGLRAGRNASCRTPVTWAKRVCHRAAFRAASVSAAALLTSRFVIRVCPPPNPHVRRRCAPRLLTTGPASASPDLSYSTTLNQCFVFSGLGEVVCIWVRGLLGRSGFWEIACQTSTRNMGNNYRLLLPRAKYLNSTYIDPRAG